MARACNNPNRATMEMVKAWQAGGAAKAALIEKWGKSADVAEVTLELIEENLRVQPAP